MRPPVSVIVPFAGSSDDLAVTAAALTALALGPGDELLIADNTGLVACPPLPPAMSVIPAAGLRAAGFARNRAAATAGGEWLVFLDADTRPVPHLLDAYFAPPPAAATGVLAGAIRDRPGDTGAAARHAAARGQMRETATLRRRGRPYAQTANCAVRAEAFAAVGGFDEGARWGEDADLGFRLADAGWALEPRPDAIVEHLSRAGVGALLAQLSGHGAGAAWVQRRHPGEFPACGPAALLRRTLGGVRDAASALAGGDRAGAGAAVLGLMEMAAFESGRLRSNRPRGRR